MTNSALTLGMPACPPYGSGHSCRLCPATAAPCRDILTGSSWSVHFLALTTPGTSFYKCCEPLGEERARSIEIEFSATPKVKSYV
jgi:hypothetical protein